MEIDQRWEREERNKLIQSATFSDADGWEIEKRWMVKRLKRKKGEDEWKERKVRMSEKKEENPKREEGSWVCVLGRKKVGDSRVRKEG